MEFNSDLEGHAEGEEPLHFYYNHEERIRNAPKIVQDFYAKNGKIFTKGIFRSLVATKLNRIMLLMVAFCAIIVFFVHMFGNNPAIRVCSDFECELNAFAYDDKVYASVKIHPLKKLREAGAKISGEAGGLFEFEDKDGAVLSKKEASCKLGENAVFLRTSAEDYDIIKVSAEVKIGQESVVLFTKAIKRE